MQSSTPLNPAISAYFAELRKLRAIDTPDLQDRLNSYLRDAGQSRAVHYNSVKRILAGERYARMDLFLAFLVVLGGHIDDILQLFANPDATPADGIAVAQTRIHQDSVHSATTTTLEQDLLALITLLPQLHRYPGAVAQLRGYAEALLTERSSTPPHPEE